MFRSILSMQHREIHFLPSPRAACTAIIQNFEKLETPIQNFFRKNQNFRNFKHITTEEGIEKGMEKSMLQGELRKALETARKMLARDLNLSLVLDVTGLTEAQLREHGII